MRATAILALLVMLTGCAKGFDVSGDQLVKMQESSALADMQCYEWMEARALQDAEAMSMLTKDAAFMYLVMRSNNDLIVALVGKSANPCGSGTNVYDMMARVSESANEANAAMFGAGLSAVKLVGGIYAAGWAVGNIADKVTGDSMEISGEGNTMERTQTTTTTIQSQASGQTTGDNNLDESTQSVDEAQPEEPGECWIDFPGGCSCESREAGNC